MDDLKLKPQHSAAGGVGSEHWAAPGRDDDIDRQLHWTTTTPMHRITSDTSVSREKKKKKKKKQKVLLSKDRRQRPKRKKAVL